MAEQGVLWLAKRYTLNFTSILLTGFRYENVYENYLQIKRNYYFTITNFVLIFGTRRIRRGYNI